MTRDKKDVSFELNLGGLFKGIGNFVDLLSAMVEKGEREFQRTGEIGGVGKSGAKGVYGFSVRVGGLGEPGIKVEPFGNIRETEEGPTVQDVREPLTDLFDEPEKITVIAEVPGADSEKIEVSLNGDILTFSAQSGERKYYKEVLIPVKGELGAPSWSVTNGLLKITIPKKA